jgi:tetratricopeptide (TPR) repeat protein
MWARILFCAAIAAAVLITPAAAEVSSLWSKCTGRSDADWKEEMKGCTAIISAKKEKPDKLAVAYNNRGLAWISKTSSIILGSNLPDLKRAIADFTQAIRLNPKYRDAYMNRGYAWYTAGDWRRGIADYSEAIKIDPTYARAYYLRSQLWVGIGERRKAIADLTELIRLDPNDAELYRDRAMIWFDEGDEDRGIADFLEAIRLNPKFGSAITLLAHLWVKRAEYDRAVALYSQVIEANPEDDDALGERGHVHFLRGDFAAAAADYQRAIGLRRYSLVNEDRALFLFIVQARSGQDGTAELEAQVARWKETPNREIPLVIELYLGRSTPEAVLKAAAGWVGNQCKADFFVGQWYLIGGKRDEARQRLQAAALEKCSDFNPYHRAAVVEMKRMAQ